MPCSMCVRTVWLVNILRYDFIFQFMYLSVKSSTELCVYRTPMEGVKSNSVRESRIRCGTPRSRTVLLQLI